MHDEPTDNDATDSRVLQDAARSECLRLKDIHKFKKKSMITSSQHTTLSIGQLHILEMMNRCRTEESLRQLKKLLFDFYSKEAVAEADRLWEAGVIDESKIEEWGQEHMRTPYIHAK